MPNIYADISVISKKSNLDLLSKITGLTPVMQHNINYLTKRGIVLDYSQWVYKTNVIETYNTEDVSKHIILPFKNCISEFIEFLNKNSCEVSICFVIGDVTDSMPSLIISREMISFAAKINAEIYFDGVLSVKYNPTVSNNSKSPE